MKTKLVFLGFVISSNGLNMDPEKVGGIKRMTFSKKHV
jgi:hypothetical protein